MLLEFGQIGLANRVRIDQLLRSTNIRFCLAKVDLAERFQHENDPALPRKNRYRRGHPHLLSQVFIVQPDKQLSRFDQ